MDSRSKVINASSLLSLMFLSGCARRGDIDQLKNANEELKSTLGRIESYSANTPSPITYEVFDIKRSKRVGYITSDVHITTGERIFLNDDIWDVKFVKIFTNPLANASDGTPQFHSSTIQLLVTFGGKGTDPKKT